MFQCCVDAFRIAAAVVSVLDPTAVHLTFVEATRRQHELDHKQHFIEPVVSGNMIF